MAQPTDHNKRAFIYRTLVDSGAEFSNLPDSAIACSYSQEGDAATLGLGDLSPLPRTGFKGPLALTWLTSQNIVVPATNNLSLLQPDGGLVARLADTEGLILSDLKSESTMVKVLESLVPEKGCYPVPRSDTYFWFILTGAKAPECLLKLCGVDIRPHKFPNHAVAQTSIARLATITIRDDRGSVPAYHLLADSTSADYFWDAVLDAMAEFDGGPIGINSLIRLG